MTAAYKDATKQRAAQNEWVKARRAEYMAKQRCALCGHQINLRLFRHMGAPRISWSKSGPSHRMFRIVCGDAIACARRKASGVKPPARKPAVPPTVTARRHRNRRKLAALRGEKPVASSPQPTRRRKSRFDWDRGLELREAGHTVNEIAADLGCDRSSVIGAAKRLDWPPSTRRGPKVKAKKKKAIKRKPAPPPVTVKRQTKMVRTFEAELAEPDPRPVCPVHGPKDARRLKLRGELRFVCCGLVVPGQEPEPVRWYEK